MNEGTPNSNEFSILLPKEASTIIKGLEGGDSIKAKIVYPGQEPKDIDPDKFSFMWTSLANKDTLSTKPFLTYHDFELQDTTLVSCLLTVKEKSTGITRHATGAVFITTPTREGWMVLGDKAGTAQLSVLTYSPQGYRKFIDLSSELGINLNLKGKPVSVAAIGSEFSYGGGKYQFVGISTDQEVKIFRTTDFRTEQRVTDYVSSILQPSLQNQVRFEINGESTFVATRNNEVFYFNTLQMFFSGTLDFKVLSAYPPGSVSAPRFNASPYHVFTGPEHLTEFNRMLYDEDKDGFVRAYVQGSIGGNGAFQLQLPVSLTGFKLMAFFSKQGEEQDEFTAFLHNPVTLESHLVQFLSNGILKNLKTIPYADVKDLIASNFIQIDPNTGYIIYTKGSEVWAYDFKMSFGLKLLDLGNETISLMRLTKYIPPKSKISGRTELYHQLLKQLIVCTYNPASPDNSGIFRLYEIPLGNQPLIKKTEETGFPKIVDVSFAPIP
ncbi:hypothetical protein [Pedobacter nyackensis]|uniref:hypothetical protein n=1 Tax=Pedobacter nyackensis TaxID=475255 RepID=UPI00292F14BF|nr:hypothetical protein [Pedobacter nyackensis]